jgi:hypothetical protein
LSGAARLARSTASRKARLWPMNWSVRSMVLADCWWQIPPFGKDFQFFPMVKIRKNAKDGAFRICGTAVAWLEAGLGP